MDDVLWSKECVAKTTPNLAHEKGTQIDDGELETKLCLFKILKKWSRWAAAVLLLHFHTCVPWQIGDCTPITPYLMHVCISWTKRVGPNFNLLSRNLHISAPIHLPHLLLLPSPGLQDLAWRKALLLNSILDHMGTVFLKLFQEQPSMQCIVVPFNRHEAVKVTRNVGILGCIWQLYLTLNFNWFSIYTTTMPSKSDFFNKMA